MASGNPSRREFLQRSVAGAAALTALSVARGAHAAGDETIRIGMIGCGSRCAGAAAENLSIGPYIKLVAMCDLFDHRLETKRKLLKQQHPEQVVVDDDHCFVGFDGYRKVIDSVDLVLIACASKFHPMYAEAAVAAGKHVFVEKPHGIDPVGVRRMAHACQLAQEKQVSLVSGLQSRYQRAWQEMIARIHDGAIGDIVAMQSMFLRSPYRVDESERRQPGQSEIQYQFYNWYHFSWLSGDDVIQSLVHNVDRMSWIMKDEMPQWAFALAGRSASFGDVYGDMFDHHTVVYEYASGPRLYALCRTQSGCYNNSTDVVMGSKGTAYLGNYEIKGQNPWKYRGTPCNPYLEEHRALIEGIRNGTPVNSGPYMCNSTLVGVLGQLAAYSGKETTWEEAAKADFQFGPPPEEASFEMKPPVLPDGNGLYPVPMPGLSKVL